MTRIKTNLFNPKVNFLNKFDFENNHDTYKYYF